MVKEKLTIDLKKVNQPDKFIEKRQNEIQNLYDSARNNRLKFWEQQAKKWNGKKQWESILK